MEKCFRVCSDLRSCACMLARGANCCVLFFFRTARRRWIGNGTTFVHSQAETFPITVSNTKVSHRDQSKKSVGLTFMTQQFSNCSEVLNISSVRGKFPSPPIQSCTGIDRFATSHRWHQSHSTLIYVFLIELLYFLSWEKTNEKEHRSVGISMKKDVIPSINQFFAFSCDFCEYFSIDLYKCR